MKKHLMASTLMNVLCIFLQEQDGHIDTILDLGGSRILN